MPAIIITTLVSALLSAAPDDEAKGYAPMPWHLIDTWWDLGEARPFQSLAIDVEIEGAIPPDVNLYIAPIGLGHLNKTPFYGGIQTNCDGNTKADPRLKRLGPGYLMSMWGERSIDAIRPPLGGYFQSSGHEGDFVSIRRPHAWTPGKYTYIITRMDEQIIDGKPYTWTGAFVYSHEKNEHVFIGSLRFPGNELKLDGKIANFVEVYGRRRPVADIPKVVVTFGTPRINGQAIAGAKASAHYPKGVPDYADASAKDGKIVITVGKAVEGRKERRVQVIK